MSAYDLIINKAVDDSGFRQRLMADPVAAAEEVGVSVSNGAQLVVHQDTAHEMNLVLGGQAAEIPEEALALLNKAQQDAAFKARLMSDPATTARAEIGIVLPPTLKIRIHENTGEVCHLVLPPIETAAGEMSDMELESVAGGKGRRSPPVPLPPGIGSISNLIIGIRRRR